MELIWWQQDINRQGNEDKYTKEFEQLVQKEVVRRRKALEK